MHTVSERQQSIMGSPLEKWGSQAKLSSNPTLNSEFRQKES
jgi:hypothetical protein